MNKTSAPLTARENLPTNADQLLNSNSKDRLSAAVRRENPATARINTDKTCQTLLDFQPKNSNLPEWRLQIQNTVRQRKNANAVPADNVSDISGISAEKPRTETSVRSEVEPAGEVNSTVANALRRIERSRQVYSGKGTGLAIDQRAAAPQPVQTPKAIPFTVLTPSEEAVKANSIAEPIAVPKPKLVRSFKIEKKSYDTNKLPPLEDAIDERFETSTATTTTADDEILAENKPLPRSLGLIDDFSVSGSAYELPHSASENSEDYAPIPVRMLAGLFDFIIIGVASVILLSPFISGMEAWLSMSGVLAFISTFSIMMFLYLTACIGGWGRSFGMRLFSLELIDAEENAYPSIHQSAVNSAVFLLSIGFAGLGFLPMVFNRENRALHDIVSGTIMIRDI